MPQRVLKFITGNQGKFEEVQKALLPIKVIQIKADLEEIQEIDPQKVIEHKLKEAKKRFKGEILIEDTSGFFQGFKGKLPGPFIKWFLEVLEPEGLYKLAKSTGNVNAEFKSIFGYSDKFGKIKYFEASIFGTMVKPRGHGGFGLDPVFLPKGSSKTLAELKEQTLPESSMRFLAALKLKAYLLKH